MLGVLQEDWLLSLVKKLNLHIGASFDLIENLLLACPNLVIDK